MPSAPSSRNGTDGKRSGSQAVAWDEAVLSLLLTWEEKVGSVMRNHVREMRAQEDVLAARAAAGASEP